MRIKNTAELVIENDFNAKTTFIENKISDSVKYITTLKFSWLTGICFDICQRLKRLNLATKLALGIVLQNANKNERKTKLLQTFDLSFWIVINFFVVDGF